MESTNAKTLGQPQSEDAPSVKDVCEAQWEDNKSDCNKFVKAVADGLGVGGFTDNMNADAIINFLENAPTPTGWFPITPGDDERAKSEADAGRFVIGGLTSADLSAAHGHVVVVVAGPFDPNHGRYPRAYWGTLGSVGRKDTNLNFSFPSPGRDNVRYYARTL